MGASAECGKGCDLVIDGARPSARHQVLTGVPAAVVDIAEGMPASGKTSRASKR